MFFWGAEKGCGSWWPKVGLVKLSSGWAIHFFVCWKIPVVFVFALGASRPKPSRQYIRIVVRSQAQKRKNNQSVQDILGNVQKVMGFMTT